MSRPKLKALPAPTPTPDPADLRRDLLLWWSACSALLNQMQDTCAGCLHGQRDFTPRYRINDI